MIKKSGTRMIRRMTNLRMAGVAVLLGIPACGGDGSHGAAPGAYPGIWGAHQTDAGTGATTGHGSDPTASGDDTSSGTGSIGAGGSQSSWWGSSDPADAATERPFSTPFTALVPQDVPWAEASVRIVGARLERGSDPKAFPASAVFAELDLTITDGGHDEWDLSTRDTWDLVLASGDRVRSENPVGVLVSPTDTAKTTLRYAVKEDTKLAGAFLELNGDDRGQLEPERIPLDAKWQRKYPVEIPSLGGMKALASDDTCNVELLIRHAAVDLNDPQGRAPVDMRFVHLDMRVTAGVCSETVYDSAFRIVVDGASHPPVQSIYARADANASVDFEALFTVPADTTKFDILLTPPYGMNTRFSVDLTKDAHLQVPGGTDTTPDAGQ